MIRWAVAFAHWSRGISCPFFHNLVLRIRASALRSRQQEAYISIRIRFSNRHIYFFALQLFLTPIQVQRYAPALLGLSLSKSRHVTFT
jgi:hypothetical protein